MENEMIYCEQCKAGYDTTDGEPVKHICRECGNDTWLTCDYSLYHDLHLYYYNVRYVPERKED